jgi:integrase
MDDRKARSRASPTPPDDASLDGKRVERLVYLVTRPDGTEFYRIKLLDQNGRKVRLWAATLTEARRVRTNAEAAIHARTFESPRDRKKREAAERRAAEQRRGPTFEEFADRFLREYAVHKRSDFYAMILKAPRAEFGERPLRAITAADLDGFRHRRLQEVSASSVRKTLNALGLLFKLARRWGVREDNPAVDLEKPSEPRHKTRFLTREEFETLLQHAEPWLKPILTTAVLTGMRLKEVAGLRWENVDRDGGLLYVAEDCKTARPRAVPMAATVRVILDAIPGSRFKRDGLVFHAPDGTPLTSKRERNRISQRTRAAAKAAELGGVTFHTLRHTAGSWMAQAGHSQVQIAKVLGHATTATADRYMHLSPAHLRSAVDSLEAALGLKTDSPALSTFATPAAPDGMLSAVKELGG